MKKTLLSLILACVLIISVMPPGIPAPASETLDKDAKLVFWVPGNAGVTGMEPGATENDNQFANAIRESTGYKNLEFSIMPTTESANHMNLLMASGEYPNALYVNSDRAFFLRYLREGLWAPVDEVISQYGPAIDKLVPAEAWATMMGDDGLKYGIPIPLHTSYDGKLFGATIQYRDDWLAKLELETPKNAQEFKDILMAVKEADPAGDGTTIPYSPVGVEPATLMAAFGMWTPYAVVNGELKSTSRLYMKDYLAFMSDLYANGLIDPEFLYQAAANRNEKTIAEKVFCFDGDVWTKTIRQTWAANGIEATTNYLPSLENIDGTYGPALPFPVANMWMFPYVSENLNECVDLINTFLTDAELESFINYGIQDVHYTVNEDGSLAPLEPGYSQVIYKLYYRLWFKPDVWWNNAVLGDFHPEIIKYANSIGEETNNVNIFAYMPTSEADLNYKSACDDIRKEYMSKIIVGDLPLEAVDAMFAEMDAIGYTEIEAAAREWYEQTGAMLAESL